MATIAPFLNRRAFLNGAAQTALVLGGARVWQTRAAMAEPAEPAGVPPRTPQAKTDRQILSGHSLLDTVFAFYPGMAAERGQDEPFDHIIKSTMPGSSTKVRWEAPPDAFDGRPKSHPRYAMAGYQLLTITEGGPVPEPYSDNEYVRAEFEQSLDYMTRFVTTARDEGDGGAGAAVLLYSIWPHHNNPERPFRAWVEDSERFWHYLQEHLLKETGVYAHIIPNHRLLMRLADDIPLGLVPGHTKLADLFFDDIHASATLCYAVSCLTFAVTYCESPVGLPAGPVTQAQADYFQAVAWEIATTYARAGLGGTDMGAVGIRPDPVLQHPRDLLGADALLVIDGRGDIFADAEGTTPARVGGPVARLVDGATVLTARTKALRATLGDGFISFPGTALLDGQLDVAGPRYIMDLVRTNAVVGLDYEMALCTQDKWWEGDHHALAQAVPFATTQASPDIGDLGGNRKQGMWLLMERYWGPTERWVRIQGFKPKEVTANTVAAFPKTTRIQLGGVNEEGIWEGSGSRFTHANVDIAARIIVNREPTDAERWSMAHFAWTRLGKVA